MEKQFNTNIIVVTWNAINYTKLTLSRLFETTSQNFALTIIDNNSEDGTQEFLSTLQIPKNCINYEFILNAENKGYGGAINQGFEVSKKINSKFTCICNNDLYFQKEWLLGLENEMSENENLGLLGAMRPSLDVFDINSEKSLKEIVDSTPNEFTPKEELDRLTNNENFDLFCEKLIKKNGNKLVYLNCPPETVVTCCAIVNNKVIELVGGLADEGFKKYGCEDIDLSWRVFNKGYKLAITNKIYVHHFRHKSINSSNLDRNKYLEENNNKFVIKWENEIFFFLKSEENRGVDLNEKFNSDEDYYYFFLRRINDKTSFYQKYIDKKNSIFIDELKIDKPIGNLYRENHTLVMFQDSKNNFVMGQKTGFYPPNMSRMLGGGLKDSEDPKIAIAREIEEETKVKIASSEVFEIGRTITKAHTVEGIMYMNVYLYGVKLKDKVEIRPSDDITDVITYDLNSLQILFENMYKLDGEFRNDKFYYLFDDWGRIYGFIHKIALKNFLKYENSLSI